MADSSYRPQVYRERGGDDLYAATGGTVHIDGGTLDVATGTSGGTVSINSGGVFSVATGAAHRKALRLATESLTLATDGSDSGVTIVGQTVDQVHTLPGATAVAKGTYYRFTVASGAAPANSHFKIKPQSGDKIFGAVAGATDGEVLTLATDASTIGDNAEVVNNGTNWQVTDLKGTWTFTNPT